MFGLILAALLSGAPAEADADSGLGLCPDLADVARTVMEARQKGVPMEKMFQIAHDSDEETRDLMVSMVEAAYERRRWHSESSQRREIEDFGEMAFKVCYNTKR